MAAFTTTMECVSLHRVLGNLQASQENSTPIHTISQSDIAVAQILCYTRSKHIELHYHYVGERLHVGEINMIYCPTHDNVGQKL